MLHLFGMPIRFIRWFGCFTQVMEVTQLVRNVWQHHLVSEEIHQEKQPHNKRLLFLVYLIFEKELYYCPVLWPSSL
jgi:hypothetical protein